jgi:hypothetical protein
LTSPKKKTLLNVNPEKSFPCSLFSKALPFDLKSVELQYERLGRRSEKWAHPDVATKSDVWNFEIF